jgi:hypothetical protein
MSPRRTRKVPKKRADPLREVEDKVGVPLGAGLDDIQAWADGWLENLPATLADDDSTCYHPLPIRLRNATLPVRRSNHFVLLVHKF